MDGGLNPGDLLGRLQRECDRLSPSEARVAEVVLNRPDAIPRMNLAALADQAQVSEPTVLRFCRSLGLDGYPHFKLELARAMAAGGTPYVHREIAFDDCPGKARAKVFHASIQTLSALQDSLDDASVRLAVERIDSARRLEILGVGLANAVAADAQQKLMRFDLACSAHHDAHLQTMAAATLGPQDVALAFSYNGRIKDIVRSAEVARKNGAHVIAVTRTGSPLAESADILLNVDTPEDTFIYAPMTTRLAHMAVVDLLATLLALARGPAITARLEQIKESLSDQWIADGDGKAGRRRRRKDAKPGRSA